MQLMQRRARYRDILKTSPNVMEKKREQERDSKQRLKDRHQRE